MTNNKFVAAVRQIAGSRPTYRTGGTGADGTCDCIGLIMGAIGKKYDMHSTNYFARFQMRTLDSLLDESQLHVGAVVYKSRRNTAQLNARYQPGGRYYNSDMLDYYHVGVVTGIDPLEITHCTSTNDINGIACDSSISAWSHIGDLLDVEMVSTGEETCMSIMMEVYAANGKPVNVRKRPNADAPKVGAIAVGETVTVTEQADGWAKITHGSLTGYMMDKFLKEPGSEAETGEENTGETVGQLVTIALPASAANALYEALKGVV